MKQANLSAALIAALAIFPVSVVAQGLNVPTLTGDAKTACEVILCLSSSERPTQCIPPLEKFFSIRHKKSRKQLRKRQNFLKLCPDGGGVDDNYLRVLARSGQSCDMPSLLNYLNQPASPFARPRTIPAHCVTYANHAWTYAIALPERQEVCSNVTHPFGGVVNHCTYHWVDPRPDAVPLTDAQLTQVIQNDLAARVAMGDHAITAKNR